MNIFNRNLLYRLFLTLNIYASMFFHEFTVGIFILVFTILLLL